MNESKLCMSSAARIEELQGLSYGDITSTGRVLTAGNVPDRLKEINEWAKSPVPIRSKDYVCSFLNSDKWDSYQPRAGDIVIDTCYKSGTTWLQTIVANMVFKCDIPKWNDDDFDGIFSISPWVELRFSPVTATMGLLEGQEHRRFLKSHLPLDGIPYYPEVKYIFAARDLRDVAYSWWNHWRSMKPEAIARYNNIPGLVGPPFKEAGDATPVQVFESMINDADDGASISVWSYWHHLATWLAYRHLPNVYIVHYATLKADPKGEIGKIADFLGFSLSESELNLIVERTSFSFMKEHNVKICGVGFDSAFENGGESFIYKGSNGRWEGELTEEHLKQYFEYGPTRVGEDGFHWLKTGQFN